MTPKVSVLLAGLVLVVMAPASRAEESAAKKPLGTWERKVGDNTLQMQIKADALTFKIVADGKTIDVESAYGVTKTGTLFGVVTKVKADGNDAPAEGHLFSFQFSVDKDTLTLKELKGTDNAEARQLVEGEYKKLN